MKIFLIILLNLITIPGSFAEISCQIVVNNYHERPFTPVSAEKLRFFVKRYLESHPEVKNLEYINQGGEAVVFRAVLANGDIQVKKFFYNSRMSPQSNVNSLALIKALNFGALEGVGLPESKLFKFVEVIDYTEGVNKVVSLNHVKGRDLDLVFRDPKVSDLLKIELFLNYQEKVEILLGVADTFSNSVEISRVTSDAFDFKVAGKTISPYYVKTYVKFEELDGLLRMDLKPNNILVDLDTGVMTIIDPY